MPAFETELGAVPPEPPQATTVPSPFKAANAVRLE